MPCWPGLLAPRARASSPSTETSASSRSNGASRADAPPCSGTGATLQEAREAQVDALVFVCDVVGAVVVRDGEALDARQVRELADELALSLSGVGALRDGAAEVGCHGLPAAGVVPDEDALFVPAVDVACDDVQILAVFCGMEGEVADAGHVAALADGVDGPEPEYLGQALALEEAVYAPDLDEEGPPVGGGREAEAEEQGAVLAEGGALYVYGIVVLAHEAGPLLLLLFAAFYGGVDEGLAGLFAERYEVY